MSCNSRASTLLLVFVLAAGCAPEPLPFEEAVELNELMVHVVEPAAEAYWDSVGTVMDLNGIQEIAPATLEEWGEVENAAATLAESGNLLLLPGRLRDDPRWVEFAKELMTAGRNALAAADARDPDAVFEAGGNVYVVCADCHAVFAEELLPANYEANQ